MGILRTFMVPSVASSRSSTATNAVCFDSTPLASDTRTISATTSLPAFTAPSLSCT
jgi:hypothetical protein